MQIRVIAFFAFCLIKVTLTAARNTDPLTLAVEKILTDMTFEIVPCPAYPNLYYDGTCQCGNPNCPACYYCDPSCEYAPSCYQVPTCQCPSCSYGQCPLPACSCYRDITNPCNVFEESCPLYVYYESCDYQCAPPYIYFPEVEYPMSAMDIKPYYYGSCWCS